MFSDDCRWRARRRFSLCCQSTSWPPLSETLSHKGWRTSCCWAWCKGMFFRGSTRQVWKCSLWENQWSSSPGYQDRVEHERNLWLRCCRDSGRTLLCDVHADWGWILSIDRWIVRDIHRQEPILPWGTTDLGFKRKGSLMNRGWSFDRYEPNSPPAQDPMNVSTRWPRNLKSRICLQMTKWVN